MNPSSFHRHDVAGDPGFGRIAALLLGTGALGLVATSAFYALAGPDAALPGGAVDAAAGQAATAASAGWMRAAALAGMPSDVMLAVGALMLAAMKRGRGAGLAVAGWFAMAISGALFIVVDAMVGFVLPAMAARPGGDAGYAASRALFDVLFAFGAWTTAAGALAAAWSARWPEFRWRAAPWLMRAAGAMGLLASTAWLLGLPGERLIGPGIALTAVALLVLAVALYTDRTQVAGDWSRPVSGLA
jgi:hypothetical protein